MGRKKRSYKLSKLDKTIRYNTPQTKYCKSKEEFDESVGLDFITQANLITKKGEEFLVGLSHGQSPAGVYTYILEHFEQLKHPEKIHFTFINSKLKRQRGLVGIRDAISFIKELLNTEKITKDQILGRSLDRDNLESYRDGLNSSLKEYLAKLNKKGLDYLIIASDPKGLVAGITRNSDAFNSKELVVLVNDTNEPELTFTPHFLKKSRRIAFLATKAEKRRTLAWLYYKWGKENESPSFLRFVENVSERMTVYIDANALTWPQLKLRRKTDYGDSYITIDMAQPFNEKAKEKLPVILMIHGFLGLNTFDALLAFIPSHKYISAAMHYGSFPKKITSSKYSEFVAKNINHVVNYFGELGHPVYIFDHSMANNYMQRIDKEFESLPGIKNYVKGRIACNPFFGREAKHASTRFIDEVILKSKISFIDKTVFRTARTLIPLESKNGFRNIGIKVASILIKRDSKINNRIWKAIKQRIMTLITEMDTLPELNRVPIEHTLNRLPIKIFAIQIKSALNDSKQFDNGDWDSGFEKYNLPVLVLKSDNDPIAKFVSNNYSRRKNVTIVDVTNEKEENVFNEHLFYMIHPQTTIKVIDKFIEEHSN